MNLDENLESYDYHLPKELIADRPCVNGRDQSRLLVYRETDKSISHHYFHELPDLLPQKSHLVMNRSKVFPCRLVGNKESGGKCEIFFLSLEPADAETYSCLIKARGKKNIGDQFFIEDLKVIISSFGEDGDFKVTLNKSNSELRTLLENIGKVPIPPYIRSGESDDQDRSDYQTVYAKHVGSVAAPTAGLHFTPDLLEALTSNKIDQSYVSLHVGMGTFKPVTSDNILEHHMHTEKFFIEDAQLKNINEHFGNIFAVGTTSLRALESSYVDGAISGSREDTDIFLYPGKKVHSIAGLITNFHLPKSSLLMLVSALIGREETLRVYREAVSQKYRFFSYGDAMLIIRSS